jgi:hypothetical protein|tara:strand:+ start:1119 stop:1574 length:456 start_codon:yes stop_codon:yes gene_type:complete
VDEKPESIKISSGAGENPWGQSTDNAASEGTLLSGNVSSFGGQGEDSPYWGDANEGEGGPSNGGWFAIGFIVAPGVIGLVSYILWFMGDLMGEFFYWLAWLVWPAGLIGGLVWSFTKGNKYFAYGLLTILVGVPMVLFLAIFVMIVVLLGL